MVPKAGFEPARLSPLPPQGSVSTNFTTSATRIETTLDVGRYHNGKFTFWVLWVRYYFDYSLFLMIY